MKVRVRLSQLSIALAALVLGGIAACSAPDRPQEPAPAGSALDASEESKDKTNGSDIDVGDNDPKDATATGTSTGTDTATSTEATGTSTETQTGTATDTGTSVTRRNYQILFVTSGRWTGNLGGLEGADAKCQQAADAANLGGRFKALLSITGVNAKDRVNIPMPIKNTRQELIANNIEDLWDGSLAAAVKYDQNGNGLPQYQDYVWTGSSGSGLAAASNCLNYQSAYNFEHSQSGSAVQASVTWFTMPMVSNTNPQQGYRCASTLRLYCLDDGT